MTENINSTDNSFDHVARFAEFARHQDELSSRLDTIFSTIEPQPVEISDPEGHILLSPEEISILWGLFPANARDRAQPSTPVIKSDKPRWFAHGSSPANVIITDQPEEAISATAHGLAHRDSATGVVTIHEIPQNGYDRDVKRLVQAGVFVHEFAHNIVNVELWSPDSSSQLVLPAGQTVSVREWVAEFANLAEQSQPISRYASAYRDENNMFPREDGAMVIGVGVAEELVESITAHLLGFIMKSEGLSFKPFAGQEEIQKAVEAYLLAKKA